VHSPILIASPFPIPRIVCLANSKCYEKMGGRRKEEKAEKKREGKISHSTK
jgi:hypothetical protein